MGGGSSTSGALQIGDHFSGRVERVPNEPDAPVAAVAQPAAEGTGLVVVI